MSLVTANAYSDRKWHDNSLADAILTTVVYDDAYFLFSRRLTSYLWRHLSNVI